MNDHQRAAIEQARIAWHDHQLSTTAAVMIADQGVMAWTTRRADQGDRRGR